jgi:Phage Mu protein F like protein
LASPKSRTLSCPHCHKPILDDGRFAGQVVCCPHCAEKLTIPHSQSELHHADASYPVIENAGNKIDCLRVVPYSQYMLLSIEEKRNFFAVSGVESIETITKVKKIVFDCFEKGADFRDFERKIAKTFGNTLALSYRELERVFRGTVMRSYTDGLLKTIEAPVITSGFPYLSFSPIDDSRTPQTHLALGHFGLNGTNVYRRDDPFWRKFIPPLTDLCRCAVLTLTTRSAAERGVKEAQEWLRTGQAPKRPEWVKLPAFDPRLELEDEWWPESLETPQEILTEIMAARARLIKETEKTSSCQRGKRLTRGTRMPITLEEGLALLQGRIDADFTLPPLDFYFKAMRRAEMENIPPWTGEPENELESLKTIDAIIACCRPAACQGGR